MASGCRYDVCVYELRSYYLLVLVGRPTGTGDDGKNEDRTRTSTSTNVSLWKPDSRVRVVSGTAAAAASIVMGNTHHGSLALTRDSIILRHK